MALETLLASLAASGLTLTRDGNGISVVGECDPAPEILKALTIYRPLLLPVLPSDATAADYFDHWSECVAVWADMGIDEDVATVAATEQVNQMLIANLWKQSP